MSEHLKIKMIHRAQERYQNIYPCSSKADLVDCFTVEDNMLMFWFNTADQSTHVETMLLN